MAPRRRGRLRAAIWSFACSACVAFAILPRTGLAQPLPPVRAVESPSPVQAPVPSGRNIWPGVSLIALGVTATVVGTYFIVTGGPPEQGEDRRKTLMRTPGFVIAGSGLAVGALGALLLARELRKPNSPGVAVRAVVAPGLVLVGINGHFR